MCQLRYALDIPGVAFRFDAISSCVAGCRGPVSTTVHRVNRDGARHALDYDADNVRPMVCAAPHGNAGCIYLDLHASGLEFHLLGIGESFRG